MDINEKVAYLKGLMEGLDFDAETKEGKIIKLMADILEDMADEITEIECDADELGEYVEALDEDLGNVEEEIFGECDCDDCDDDCDCCNCDDCDEDGFEIVCPECNDTIVFEEVPEGDSITCPSCGKEISLN